MKKLKEFDDFYTGDKTFNWQGEEGQEGQMEAFSPHVDKVLHKHRIDPTKVWTIMEAEDFDGLIIVTGFHFVNRFQYFVSNESWKSDSECYIWCKSEAS